MAAKKTRTQLLTKDIATEEGTSSLVHITWFALGAALGFLIPYVFTSILDIHHDLYYLIYFALALAFIGLYIRVTGVDLMDFFRRNWHWSLGLGVLATGAVVGSVLSGDSTSRPSGIYLAFEVLWRGAAYGLVDALFLTAFPGLVALGLFKGNLTDFYRKAGFVVATSVMVMIVTAVYHLGYEQFREEGVQGPEAGNVIISIPMLATANPVGSLLAHMGMHIAAVVHSYETDLYLPPRTEASLGFSSQVSVSIDITHYNP